MSTATISQPQNYIGKRENQKVKYCALLEKKFKLQIYFYIQRTHRVISIFDSGSDTDSLLDSPLANSAICALCSVSSHLGQGELNRYAPSAGFDPFQSTQARHTTQTRRSTRSGAKAASQRSLKNSIYHLSECGDSLTRVGRSDIADPTTVFEPSGHVIAHHCCAAWSSGVAPRINRTSTVKSGSQAISPLQYGSNDGNGTNIILVGVDRAVLSSLTRKCKYCQNYGASVKCKVDNCQSWYHYPCAVASGAFQDAHSCSILCTPEHRHEADKISSNR